MSLVKTLHKFSSPVLYKIGLYQKMWQAHARKKPFTFVIVYHRVVSDQSDGSAKFGIEKGISASAFELQMRFMLRYFTPVKASQAQRCSSNEMQFAVTLDDGYEDNYLVAAPILKKLGIPATFFVVSQFVGTDRLFWWEQVADLMHRSDRAELDMQVVFPHIKQADGDKNILPIRSQKEREYAYEQLCSRIRKGLHVDIPEHMQRVSDYFDVQVREQGRDYGLMNWQQLNELARQGFEIGGHTATHCNVVGADETLLQQELVESVNLIEANLETPVESFAYPYGLFEASSKVVSDLLARTNCKAAFTCVQGAVNADLPPNELPRTRLNRPYDFACAFNLQDTINNGANSG